MTKVVVGILIGLIAWDVVTTYYGTLAVFSDTSGPVLDRIAHTKPMVHIVSAIFAIAVMVFVLSYRHIFRSHNLITKGVLVGGFIYDFATSIYGTAVALEVNRNPTPPQIAIILLLAIMATASPLLINQVLE